jgi:predicted DNA-binding transcriptional regulator AlpA
VDAELLTEREVAGRYRLSTAWLRRARTDRRGPSFLRIGARMIRYRPADIERFLDSRLVDAVSHVRSTGATAISGVNR